MNKVMLRWAFCLLLLPALHAAAQDTRGVPSKISLNAADHKGDPGTSAIQPDASTTDGTQKSEQTASAPAFPDSVMRNYEIEVFQNVLKMADFANFKYKDALASAKTGNVMSIYTLLDFNRVVDGVDALNHAVTCLELIPVAGDQVFGTAVELCAPKMKKVLLERLMLAQVRTKKTFLRQSLTNWAPYTWKSLNAATAPATGTTTQPSDQKQFYPVTTPSGKQ